MPDDQVSDLAFNLASVNVPSQTASATPVVFGNFEGVNMSGISQPMSMAIMQGLVEANRKRADEAATDLRGLLAANRQDVADLLAGHGELHTAIDELRKATAALVAANPDVKAPGPTDQAGVAEALRDKASRQQSLKDFGAAWLLSVKDFFPLAAYQDEEFMLHYYDLKRPGNARRHSRPASASARTEQPRSQRFKFSDLSGKPPRDVKIAKWNNDNPEGFTCDMEGRLADPLPQFFQSRIAEQPTSTAGRPNLPDELLRQDKLEPGSCYYKGCRKPGYRWNHCPKLAMHVARISIAGVHVHQSQRFHVVHNSSKAPSCRPGNYGLVCSTSSLKYMILHHAPPQARSNKFATCVCSKAVVNLSIAHCSNSLFCPSCVDMPLLCLHRLCIRISMLFLLCSAIWYMFAC